MHSQSRITVLIILMMLFSVFSILPIPKNTVRADSPDYPLTLLASINCSTGYDDTNRFTRGNMGVYAQGLSFQHVGRTDNGVPDNIVDYYFWVNETNNTGGKRQVAGDSSGDSHGSGDLAFSDNGTIWYGYGGYFQAIPLDIWMTNVSYNHTDGWRLKLDDVTTVNGGSGFGMEITQNDSLLLFWRDDQSGQPTTDIWYQRYKASDMSAKDIDMEFANSMSFESFVVAPTYAWTTFDPRYNYTFLSWAWYHNVNENLYGSYPFIYSPDNGTTWYKANNTAYVHPIEYHSANWRKQGHTPWDNIQADIRVSGYGMRLGCHPNGTFYMQMQHMDFYDYSYEKCYPFIYTWNNATQTWSETNLSQSTNHLESAFAQTAGTTRNYTFSAYVNNNTNSSIRVRVSADNGSTWDDEEVVFTLAGNRSDEAITALTYCQPRRNYTNDEVRLFYSYTNTTLDDIQRNKVGWIKFNISGNGGNGGNGGGSGNLSVTTNQPTGVEETNATLHGTIVNDTGESCNLSFEYGITISYGDIINYTFNQNLSHGWNSNLTFPESIWIYNSSIEINDTCENFCQQGGILDTIEWIFYQHPYRETISWKIDREINELTNINHTTEDPLGNYSLYLQNQSKTLAFKADNIITFHVNLTGLMPGQLYHYRANITNSTTSANGTDVTFLTKPNATVTSYANISNVIDINVSWVKADGTNTTYIERNTVTSWSRGSGTLVYNDTGTYYYDDSQSENPLEQNTTYYYRLWSCANWSGFLQFSDSSLLVYNTTYSAGIPLNEAAEYNYPYLNISWVYGEHSDQVIVIARNDTWTTSRTQSGNWIRQNSTTIYFNISDTELRYYTLFSYNTTDNIYSLIGVNISYFNYAEFNVFNESNPSQAITNWNIHIKNNDGSETYTAYNKNNPLYLDINDVPNGQNIIIKVWATGYKQRLKTMDLLPDRLYNITFYLPPVETTSEGEEDCTLRAYTNIKSITNPAIDAVINLTYLLEDMIEVQIYNDSLYVTYGGWLTISDDYYDFNTTHVIVNKTILDDNTSMARASYYYLHCVGQKIETPIYYIRIVETYETSSGIFERPIEDARVSFEKYINTTGEYEEISSLLTDANGFVNLHLIPSELYQVNITKTGYIQKIANYLPAPPNEFGQTTEKTFKIEQVAAPDVNISDIRMETLSLGPYNATTMWIYYLNLNDDNSYVNFSIYDYIGSSLLTTYNISVHPNNITLYFNFSSYVLSGDVLQVVSRAERINGTIYTITKYFNINEARRFAPSSYAPIAAIFSVGICLFGLTIAHPKRVFGFVGIITMIIAIALTVFVEQTWYLHLLQAIELILLIIIVLIFREEGVHAV